MERTPEENYKLNNSEIQLKVIPTNYSNTNLPKNQNQNQKKNYTRFRNTNTNTNSSVRETQNENTRENLNHDFSNKQNSKDIKYSKKVKNFKKRIQIFKLIYLF